VHPAGVDRVAQGLEVGMGRGDDGGDAAGLGLGVGGQRADLVRDDAKRRALRAGAGGLDGRVERQELRLVGDLLDDPGERADLLELVGEALGSRRPIVRVGEELDDPTLRDAALVGASYGLTNRSLGAVSILGPQRMDYEKAIRSVRAAAHELSRFVESVYEDN
jgi:transcriptional regulator of heat shock response